MAIDTVNLQKIECFIEEHLYLRGMNAGDGFFEAHRGIEKGKSQAANLKTRAYRANRFSEIVNFVKNQIGKEKQGKSWLAEVEIKDSRGETQRNVLGVHIIKDLEFIDKEVERLFEQEEQLEVRLRLTRSYVDALVTQYLYRNKLTQINS